MRFEKVSFEVFKKDVIDNIGGVTEEAVKKAYESIKLPERKTKYSAGYDVCTPFAFYIPAGAKCVIPTGIRVVFSEDEMETWHLQMYVRSSVGIKDGIVLTNGTGVIDPDYHLAKNEGDMMLALYNTSDTHVYYDAGDRICQAVFAIHGLTENDKASGARLGGVGSTGKA